MKKIFTLAIICFSVFNCFSQNKMTCEQWKADIDFFKNKLAERHANIYHTISPEEFQKKIESLKNRACQLKDEDIIVGLSEITALIQDGHTYLDIRRQPWNLKRLPLRFEYFDDGLFVTGADSPLKNLIGKQIIEINSVPVEKVISEIKKIGYRENEFTERLSIPRFIAYPNALKYFGLLENIDLVDVTVKTDDQKTEKVNLTSLLEKDIKWVNFAETQQNLPLTFQNNEAIYWFKYLPAEKLLYLQFNSHAEDQTHNFKVLTKELIDKINAEKPAKFVVDIQKNGGGNSRLTFPLITAITHFENQNPDGQSFVIIGRNTYSASLVFASEVKRFTKAVFIGEPTGVAPNLYTENGYLLTLPNSRVEISYSSMFFQSAPFDNSKWIAPQIAVKYLSADYFGLKEPIIEEILKYQPPTKSIYQTVYEFVSNNQIEKALKTYQEFKADYRNRFVDTEAEMRRTAGRIARDGRTENAEKIYELIIKEYPNRVTSIVNLAQFYEGLGQNKKAFETYTKAQKIIKTDSSINEAFRHRLTDIIEEKINTLRTSN